MPSPDILKFSTKHKYNPFTLNCYMVYRTFLFIFHAGSRSLGSNNFRNSSYKESTAGVTVNNYSLKKITPGVIITQGKSTPGVIFSWEKFTPTWKKVLP